MPMTHSSTLQFLPVKGDRTVVVEALKQQIESSVIPLFVKPCERAKKVGVILDADLKFQKQISNISKTVCYHLKKNIQSEICLPPVQLSVYVSPSLQH